MSGWMRTLVLMGSLGLAVSMAQAEATDGTSCGAVEGVEAVLEAGTIVLVGEMHGTEESPAFVADLMCSALERGLPVTAALEIPKEEEERVLAYLASDGGAEARAALLVGPFWDGEVQYGVSSEAMLTLLDALRRHQKAGRPVEVALLDRRERTTPNARDAFMASRLAEAAQASPRRLVVALTGNIHTRTRKGAPWDDDYEPMGLALEQGLPDRRVVALDVAYTGGTAWVCMGQGPEACKAHEIAPTPADGSGRRIVLDDSLQERGYDGYYAVGHLTASPPAVETLTGPAEPPR